MRAQMHGIARASCHLDHHLRRSADHAVQPRADSAWSCGRQSTQNALRTPDTMRDSGTPYVLEALDGPELGHD